MPSKQWLAGDHVYARFEGSSKYYSAEVVSHGSGDRYTLKYEDGTTLRVSAKDIAVSRSLGNKFYIVLCSDVRRLGLSFVLFAVPLHALTPFLREIFTLLQFSPIIFVNIVVFFWRISRMTDLSGLSTANKMRKKIHE